MIDAKICDWLMDNADAPIRYRVAREFFKDEKLAKEIEPELIKNPAVKLWLGNFRRIKPPHRPIHGTIHGAPDYCLENTINKMVQFGLNAEMPLVVDEIQRYMDIVKSIQLRRPYRKLDANIIILSNMLMLGNFQDKKVREFMLGSLDELFTFATLPCLW